MDPLLYIVGQVIRIWGRIPFQPSSQAPPPIRPDEPFWHRLFQQQILLQQQQNQQQKMMQETVTSSKQTDRATVANTKAAEVQSLAGVTTPTNRGGVQEHGHTVPITTGAEPISIWGTGQPDDSGEYRLLLILKLTCPVFFRFIS